MEKAAEKGEKVQNDGYKMMGKDPNAGAGQFLWVVLHSFNSSAMLRLWVFDAKAQRRKDAKGEEELREVIPRFLNIFMVPFCPKQAGAYSMFLNSIFYLPKTAFPLRLCAFAPLR